MNDIKVLSAFPRTSKIPNPESGKLEEVTNDIVITHQACDIYFGNVKFKKEDGVRILDASNLDDLTPNEKDLPPGIECRVMACDMNHPMLPVEFWFNGHYYRGVWIMAKDVMYQAGHQGHHLTGE